MIKYSRRFGTNKFVSSITQIFRALSDENRLKILLFIKKSEQKLKKRRTRKKSKKYKISRKINKKSQKSGAAEKIPPGICLKDITKKFNLTFPTISHHIKELIYADLINTKKVGRWVYCKVNKKSLKSIQKAIKKLS